MYSAHGSGLYEFFFDVNCLESLNKWKANTNRNNRLNSFFSENYAFMKINFRIWIIKHENYYAKHTGC